MERFNKRKFVIAPTISIIWFGLPTIHWFIERELIEDDNAFVIGAQRLVFQITFFFRLKRKTSINNR